MEMLHMDLFGPVAYISIGGNKYGLVIVDDYSRFTWVLFLQDKSETQEVLKKLLRRVINEFDAKVKKIRSDNGAEFMNTKVEDLLDEEGNKHEFLAPYAPQQNGVAKRKNRALIEMARTMLDEYKTSNWFWVEAINTAGHATNRSTSTSSYRGHLMSPKPVTYPMYLTFKFLEVSALFYIRGQSLLNLLLKFMWVSCLVMIQSLTHTMFSM
jgi:transposase InsO family protein